MARELDSLGSFLRFRASHCISVSLCVTWSHTWTGRKVTQREKLERKPRDLKSGCLRLLAGRPSANEIVGPCCPPPPSPGMTNSGSRGGESSEYTFAGVDMLSDRICFLGLS